MQRFFVNGPHIKKTVPSPEKENEPKQISRRVLPRNSATHCLLPHPSLSRDSPSTLPISEPFLPCSALPRPLWYLPAAGITHLQTFGPRLLYAWTKMVEGSEWGSIFCYLHWTTK